jgi:hypothetical protein
VTVLGDEIARSAVELATSLWAELGVTTSPRRHDWQAIDLEPLIVFTACCASGDARLRARTIEWCAENERYLSTFRLQRFTRLAHPTTRRAAERYVAAVAAATRKAKRRPPPRARTRASANSLEPDLRRPSLIQLRLRALVGVSARAEVLKLMLAEPDLPRTSSSMVARAGYGKGGVAQALDMLTAAGITGVQSSGNRLLYRLNRASELAQCLNGLPAAFPDWVAIFRITEGTLRYAHSAPTEPAARVAAAAALARELADDLQRVAPGARPPRITGAASIAGFDQWARTFVEDQAGASSLLPRKREVVYTVHRLLLGGWIATVTEPGEHPRPLALSDSPELKPDRRAHRRIRVDEIGAAADVIESMLLDMRTRDLQRSQGSLVRRQSLTDAQLPALSREFASELLQPMHKGQSTSFTEEFLQRWFLNRRHRFTASA